MLIAPPESRLLGLDHGAFARAAVGVVIVIWLVISGARRAGPRGIARVISGVAFWAILAFGLTGIYAYRFEISEVGNRVIDELIPSDAKVGRGGEVILRRRPGGAFVIPTRINDVEIPLLFDTGASTVVLRAEDAARVGVDLANLDFDADVVTANGPAKAARTRIDRMAVGPIVLRDVRAMVARPGALSEGLLGMTFLERLQSFTVERGQLVLKAR